MPLSDMSVVVSGVCVVCVFVSRVYICVCVCVCVCGLCVLRVDEGACVCECVCVWRVCMYAWVSGRVCGSSVWVFFVWCV